MKMYFRALTVALSLFFCMTTMTLHAADLTAEQANSVIEGMIDAQDMTEDTLNTIIGLYRDAPSLDGAFLVVDAYNELHTLSADVDEYDDRWRDERIQFVVDEVTANTTEDYEWLDALQSHLPIEVLTDLVVDFYNSLGTLFICDNYYHRVQDPVVVEKYADVIADYLTVSVDDAAGAAVPLNEKSFWRLGVLNVFNHFLSDSGDSGPYYDVIVATIDYDLTTDDLAIPTKYIGHVSFRGLWSRLLDNDPALAFQLADAEYEYLSQAPEAVIWTKSGPLEMTINNVQILLNYYNSEENYADKKILAEKWHDLLIANTDVSLESVENLHVPGTQLIYSLRQLAEYEQAYSKTLELFAEVPAPQYATQGFRAAADGDLDNSQLLDTVLPVIPFWNFKPLVNEGVIDLTPTLMIDAFSGVSEDQWTEQGMLAAIGFFYLVDLEGRSDTEIVSMCDELLVELPELEMLAPLKAVIENTKASHL